MANYVIGDIQGCFDAFMRLLDEIQFDPHKDKLWLVGDLVNRGEDSLATLRYCREHKSQVQSVLGNHDLHLIACYYEATTPRLTDTLSTILYASDAEQLIQWLRNQPLARYLPKFRTFISHAGLYPAWSIPQALDYAEEVTPTLQGKESKLIQLLSNMYGNEPSLWDDQLNGWDRKRFIINAFTRMRFLTEDGGLEFKQKTGPGEGDQGLSPWFECITPPKKEKILFGHWAALRGECPVKNIYALDTGCVWGECLTALRLEDLEKISVPA